MDLLKLFETAAFEIRHLETGRRLFAVECPVKLKKFPLPDRPSYKPVERKLVSEEVTYDPKTGAKIKKEKVEVVHDLEKRFDFTEHASSDVHGGMISADVGDYIVRDGDAYFVIPIMDRRNKAPIFARQWARI